MADVEMLTGDGFREFGFPNPKDVPRHERDRMWSTLHTLIEATTGPGLGWTEDDRRYVGKVYFESFIQGASDLATAHIKLAHLLTTLKLDRPKFFTDKVWHAVGVAGAREYGLSMGLWYESGLPKVVLDPKYAASLMGTRLTSEVQDLVLAPWSAFTIELPNSPLTFVTKTGEVIPVDQLFVHTKQGGFTITVLTGEWHLFSLGTATAADFVRDDIEKVDDFLLGHRNTLNDIEHLKELAFVGFNKDEATKFMEANGRLMALGQRLVAGTCLAMSDPREIKQRPLIKRHVIKSKHRRGLPVVRTFEVGHPVKIDARPFITDFLQGRRSSVHNVQGLVRGHWKSQAHGANYSLRRPLQVEPYWRGPEDAPIVLRPHMVGATRE